MIKFHFKKSHKADKGRGFFGLIGRDPRVDWLVIIIFSLVVAAVLVFIGLSKYFYFDANLSKQTKSQKSNVADTINVDTLDRVLREFDSQAALRERLLQEYVPAKDPSI